MKLIPTLLLVAGLARSAFVQADGLPMSTPAAEAIDATRLGGMRDLVTGIVAEGRIAGANVLILRNGRVVDRLSTGMADLEAGAAMKPDTIFRIYSMTKVVTAVAVLQLIEQNRVQLDAPITNWIPELSGVRVLTGGTADAPVLEPLKGPITVRQCLNHTAGFSYDLFSGSPVHELYKREDLWSSPSLDEFIRRVARLPLIHQPGTAYAYSISDDVLGLLVQRVSRMSFEDYVARHITGPLTMNDTFFDVPVEKRGRVSKLYEPDASGKLKAIPPIIGVYEEPGRGIAAGGCGLFSTIDDYARFAQMLCNGGELDGARVLGRKTVELASMNSLAALPSPYHPFGRGDGWGLMSAVRVDPLLAGEPSSAGMLYWSGAATTHFFVDPKEKLVALVFCQLNPFDKYGLFSRFRTAVYQALE
jgi:CubicO group peptidase (beta-lactamase class C family)